MNAARERSTIRLLHLILSIPIIGYIYGPVAAIPRAAAFTRFVAVPVVIFSGLWLWQKPRIKRWLSGGSNPPSHDSEMALHNGEATSNDAARSSNSTEMTANGGEGISNAAEMGCEAIHI